MIDIRYCKRCKKAYDIGLNFEICPDCRNEKEVDNVKSDT